MFIDKVKNTIQQYALIAKKDKILIGVSGGPDSVALTYCLDALRKELGIELHIAHLDHMLRQDSSRDALFVKKLADSLSIPCSNEKINVRKSPRKGSIEEIAREKRLGFLFKIANQTKSTKIALGHNLNDQAETVLMRIIRGTGLYGLSGILPKRTIAGHCIIRPLLGIQRKDIERFLKHKKISFCIDQTNASDVYFRNKLRNQLIPTLEKGYNVNIQELLSNLAENAGYDYDYLRQAALHIIKKMGKDIALEKFLKLHISMQRLLLRLKITQIIGDTRRINFTHILEIEDMIHNRPINSIVDLPKGISAVKLKKNLRFYLKKQQ
ncbi:MAG: tRNA lysidine(34) synthetase TilS [Candidatus Omnitrophota bacterium]|jgi:tRNA(Ile)-lysidine synthase